MSDSEEGSIRPEDIIGTYQGERDEEGRRHGQGKAVLPNGDRYIGTISPRRLRAAPGTGRAWEGGGEGDEHRLFSDALSVSLAFSSSSERQRRAEIVA